MEEQVWSDIEVTWNSQWKYWEIYGDNIESGEYEWLGHSDLKKYAVDDAMIYAFDTAAGPARSKLVKIYSKTGKLLSTKEGHDGQQ